jgi:hypothetical protein
MDVRRLCGRAGLLLPRRRRAWWKLLALLSLIFVSTCQIVPIKDVTEAFQDITDAVHVGEMGSLGAINETEFGAWLIEQFNLSITDFGKMPRDSELSKEIDRQFMKFNSTA